MMSPVTTSRSAEVAVLLPTYNGSRFVEEQIISLGGNSTPFTLHWLDDHSKDNSRGIVKQAAARANIRLKEWHQSRQEGVPGSFFRLLECVDADIYLFCDQDDIWQPGKIDATVENLMPDLGEPAICFSEPLLFRNSQPENIYSTFAVIGSRAEAEMSVARVFTPMIGHGHTQGFTKPLRDLFLKHNEIARSYAFMHDMWMYAIAVASGSARLLPNVPTTLHRCHDRNASGSQTNWHGRGMGSITMTWQQHKQLRSGLSKHAEGFILASATLPRGPEFDRLLSVARLVAPLSRRQSLSAVIRLARSGILWGNRRLAIGLATSCLLSHA